jgi:NADPH-dependent 2,4-dienoyl-CoA reductase/sulfur reductase-like enzyme/nitrite reductase/ring-hydroxylating ferredoxin subunit
MTAIWAASLADLQTGMTAVELDGVKVLLVRDGEDVRAFEGTCPHAKAPLEQGALCEGRIICPWHMATFDARTGALLEPVAMRGLCRYPVEIAGDAVLVDPASPTQPKAAAPPDERVFAIAGAGAAAAMAAATLRDEGFGGRIVMIGPDGAEPLDRTQLSKMAIASADFDRGTLPLVDAAELGLERVQASVQAIDPASRTLTLSTGARVHYDAALLATGAEPKPPRFAGDGAGRVLTLRHLGDVDAILASVRPGQPAVVIGTGFIAMEAASALAEREMKVTVVGRDSVPFATLLGDRVGAAIRTLHESKGVEFRLGAKVDRVDQAGVVLASGERLPAGLVVAGLGVSPVLDYAPALKRAGDGGLATDPALRVCEGVWAAGDIASPEGWPRIEHWRVAQQHGRIAALGMLGQAAAYEGVPFFWSAQAGKRLQMLGHASGWEEVAFDGDVEAFDFIVWYLKSGHVQAALICARDREAAILSHAMRADLTLVQARAAVADT